MLTKILPIIKSAAQVIMKYYDQDLDIQTKSDNSPVTMADIQASELIEKNIKDIFPYDHFLSEENLKDDIDFTGKVWLLDPLDGTKFFIEKIPTFSIMISLIDNGIPVFGIIYYPVTGEFFWAEKGKGCRRNIDGKDQKIEFIKKDENLEDMSLSYKPSALKMLNTKKIIDKNWSYKQEVRPSGYICTEFLKGNYDFVLLGWGNKYEMGAFDILISEAGGFWGNTDGSSLNYFIKDIKFHHGCVGCKSKEYLKLFQ